MYAASVLVFVLALVSGAHAWEWDYAASQNAAVMLQDADVIPPPAFLPGTCESTRLITCTNAFSNYTGYVAPNNATGVAYWANVRDIMSYLTNLKSRNLGDMTGWYQVCNAFEIFYSCIQPAGNLYCISVENLVNFYRWDPVLAYALRGMFDQYSFECSAGFFTLLRTNEQLICAQRVLRGLYNSSIVPAMLLWEGNVFHDPARTCGPNGHTQNFTNAVASLFSLNECGGARETDRWWGCETAFKYTQARFPNCRWLGNGCLLGGGPFGGGLNAQVEEWARDHHKVEENGRHWYKLPDRVEKVNGMLQTFDGEWVGGNEI